MTFSQRTIRERNQFLKGDQQTISGSTSWGTENVRGPVLSIRYATCLVQAQRAQALHCMLFKRAIILLHGRIADFFSYKTVVNTGCISLLSLLVY